MDVRLITKSGVEERGVEELPLLLQGEDNLVWVDIPAWDDEAVRVLSEVFRFHPLAVNDAMERNRVPKMHAYHDHVFVILHAPERGKHGHVHYIELDQFIGLRYLVTVHGPINPAVHPDVALRATCAVLQRIQAVCQEELQAVRREPAPKGGDACFRSRPGRRTRPFV
jgi:magnesium transporter